MSRSTEVADGLIVAGNEHVCSASALPEDALPDHPSLWLPSLLLNLHGRLVHNIIIFSGNNQPLYLTQRDAADIALK